MTVGARWVWVFLNLWMSCESRPWSLLSLFEPRRRVQTERPPRTTVVSRKASQNAAIQHKEWWGFEMGDSSNRPHWAPFSQPGTERGGCSGHTLTHTGQMEKQCLVWLISIFAHRRWGQNLGQQESWWKWRNSAGLAHFGLVSTDQSSLPCHSSFEYCLLNIILGAAVLHGYILPIFWWLLPAWWYITKSNWFHEQCHAESRLFWEQGEAPPSIVFLLKCSVSV